MSYAWTMLPSAIGDLAAGVTNEAADRYREALRALLGADHVHEGYCCQAHVDACDLLGIDVHEACCR